MRLNHLDSLAFALLAGTLTVPAAAQQFVEAPGMLAGKRWSEGVECVDVDNDGDLDLVFADGEGFSSAGAKRQNKLAINMLVETGSLSFVTESVARLGGLKSNGKGVTSGDVNGDGYVDLLFLNAFNTDTPFLYINRGASQPGFFDMKSATNGFTVPMSSAGAMFGDLDDDGDLDLILCDSGSSFLSGSGGKPHLYFNDGAGVFTENAAALGAPTKKAHMDVQLADVDGDWDLDFIGLNRATNSGGNHYLMLNDGTGQFTDASTLLPNTSGSVYEAEVGDLDGDTDHDLFFVSLSGFQEGHVQNELVETGSLSFKSGSPQSGSVDDNEIALLDYNSDGDYDIIVGSLGSTERLYRNDGGLNFSLQSGAIQGISDSTLDAAIGDLDNDGDYDLITAQGESNSGQWNNKVFLNNGPADNLPPVVVATRSPDAALTWPLVVHAKVRDQVRDDGISYVTAHAVAAENTGVTHAVSFTGGAFSPPSLNIAAGDTVVWSNSDATNETVTSTMAPWTYDLDLPAGSTTARTFVTPGTYQYASSTSGAKGALTVTGTTVSAAGLAAGGTLYRFSLAAPSPPWSSAVVEMFFTDWVGNQSVADGISVPGNVTIGTNYCGPAVPNSSGQSAIVTGQGSATVADNNVTLVASALPANKFGYFLVSATQGFIANPGGSQGNLCLSGKTARYSGNILFSGSAGTYQMAVDLTLLPPPINLAVSSGDTWNFQTWFRDSNPTNTSNFTDGLSILFN